jgi:hypothetical protein
MAGTSALLYVAALNSIVGRFSVGFGHGYYQGIRDLKTKLEKELGLAEYAIVSTPGMRRGHDLAAAGTPRHAKGRWTKITSQIQALLLFIAVLSGAGALYATYRTVSQFIAERTSAAQCPPASGRP